MTFVDDTRPPDIPLLGAGDSVPDPPAPLLTCMLPVRNAAHDLPGFFASLRGLCDAVVALDDGSTDDTLALLEAEPLVKRIIRRPVREGYAGWNDATNRNRLLQAAADLNPRWLISLDADERIDAEDRQALREFLRTDAVPGFAYGFRWAQMRIDTSLFWPRYIWIYRLFHFERGQRFPPQRLHFVPIPTSIPDFLRVKTTLRIQHLGELTAERRLIRFAKYLEADPARRFQESYTSSVEVVDEQRLHRWMPRPPFLPILVEEAEAALQQAPAAGQPAITVIVLANEGTGGLQETLDTLGCAEEVEILVVAPGWQDQQRRAFEQDHPRIAVIPVARGVLLPAMRNAGLRQARGVVVLFLEAGARILAPGLQGWLDAHRRGYVMVAGQLAGASDSALASAALQVQPHDGRRGESAGPLPYPPLACSYARFALHETGGFPEALPEDDARAINAELFRRGYLAWFDPALRIAGPPGPARPLDFVTTLVATGQATGRRILRPRQQTGRLLPSLSTGIVPAMGGLRRFRAASSPGTPAGWREKTMVLVGHGLVGAGALAEGVRVWIRGDLQVRQRRPQMILWVGFAEQRITTLLIQCDYFQRRLTAVPVTPKLRLRIEGRPRETSLGDLQPIYRSLDQRALRVALEEAIGLAGLDYIMGNESDLDLILRPTASRVEVMPDARRRFVEAMQVGRLVSSLQRNDIGLLQRTLG